MIVNGLRHFVVCLIVCSALTVVGCQTKGQTAAVVGAGLGALIGQAVGGDTGATLIGAAAGTGLGYIIGNEMDKNDAEKHTADPKYTPPVSPLSGTTWQVISVVPEPDPPFKSMVVEFGRDGYVTTSRSNLDGVVSIERERYRVVGSTLVVNKPGYLINARFLIDGNQLIVDAEKFRGVLNRVGSRS